MTIREWINFFKKFSDIKIFHINHLKLLTRMNEHSLRMSLSRLSNKKLIKRICRGFYANPFNVPTLEEISRQIYQPSYVSLESALSSYGILSQIPMVLTCVTTQLPHTFRTNFGTIEYRQIKSIHFWGFIEKKGCFMAEPEKALLDYIYLSTSKNKKIKISLLNINDINKKKTKRYARKMNIEETILSLIENIQP